METRKDFVIQTLESRVLLLAAPTFDLPAGVFDARLAYTDIGGPIRVDAELQFRDNNATETGHRVEWSEDGDFWPPAGTAYGQQVTDSASGRFAGVLPQQPAIGGSGGVGLITHVSLEAGQKLYYRIQAVEDPTFSAYSEVITPEHHQDLALQLSATPMGSQGTTFSWPVVFAGPTDLKVMRKNRGANRTDFSGSTVFNVPLAPGANAWTDIGLTVGLQYEYRFELRPQGLPSPVFAGHVFAGNDGSSTQEVPVRATLDRGNMLIVVEERVADGIPATR